MLQNISNESGQSAINKINANFAELAGGDTTQQTNKLQTQGGKLSTSDGYITSGITTDSDFLNYLHTIDFIKAYNVADVTVDTGDTLSIFCYDSAFALKTVVSSLASMPSGTAYIRLQVTKSSAYANVKPIIVTTQGGKAVAVKSTIPTLGSSKFFSYEVKTLPVADEDTTSFNGSTSRYYDNGYVILPPNYSQDGEPVQLVIYTHGSDCWKFGATSVNPYYDLQQFIAKCGFAVADCRGITNTYKDADVGTAIDDGVTPVSISCYCQLYDFLMRNFNLRADGCYIYGKSSGGLEPALLSCLQPFPIRAAAGLAPMLSQYQDMFAGVNYTPNVRWQLQRFGYDMTNVSSTPTAAQILGQIRKMQGYDPLIASTNLDIVEFNTMLQSIAEGTTYQWNESMIDNETLQSALADAHKNQPCPIKFWYVNDDQNTPINLAVRIYKQLVDAGNGICKLRKFPNNCGKHHAVDNASNAPTTTYHTPYGGDIVVAVAYAEMIDWFKYW